MYCTNCGAKNDDKGRFCIKCGASLEMNKEAHSNQEKKERGRLSIGKMKLNTRAVIIFAAVIAVILIVIWVLPDSPSTGTSSLTTDSEQASKELSTEELPTEEQSTEEYIEIPEGERTVLVSSEGFDCDTTEPVVLYHDGLEVVFLGIDYQDAQDPEVVIRIENQSSKKALLSQECMVINGYTFETTLASEMEPEEVQIERIAVSSSELEMCGIDEIVELKLFLNVQSEGEDSGSLIGPVLIKNPDSQYVQEYDDTGVEIYRKNGIRIVAKISLTWENRNDWFDKIWSGEDFEVEVYIENSSENSCTISTTGDVIVTEPTARRDEHVLQEDDQGIQFTHKVMAGSKRVVTFYIAHETLKEYGRNGAFVPISLKSMLEIWDIGTQNLLEKTDYIEFLYPDVLDHLEYLEEYTLAWSDLTIEQMEQEMTDMFYPDSDEEIKLKGYAYVDVCGNYGPEVFIFTNNSMIFFGEVFADGNYISGFIQGEEMYDFAGQEDFYCVYSPSDSVTQLLHSFRGYEETEYTQEIVLEANLDSNEYYHITDARMQISKEEFDRLWSEYLKDGEKIEIAPIGDVSVIEKWKSKYGVSDETSGEESATIADKSH